MVTHNTLTCGGQDVLLCNAGSTTLKLQCRSVEGDAPITERVYTGSPDALLEALEHGVSSRVPPRAIVHRIVHAGEVTERPQALDAALLDRIVHWGVLAPLHNPLAVSLIDLFRRRWPGLPQYAVFDSGLYASLPDTASQYALPPSLSPRWPVRRYGFHGLAHRSQWRQVQAASQAAGISVPERLVSIHLGGGCSLSCWQGDRVVDTSMGYTPLEGLVMATRSGSVDPGLLLHLLQHEEMSVAELGALLGSQSGLASLDGGNGDVRRLLASSDPHAQTLLALYCQQIRKGIGAAVAVLGGLDAISIGGGVGEHQPDIRERVLGELPAFGVQLDRERNRESNGLSRLHGHDSAVALWLTPVNEFDEMFRQCEPLITRPGGRE
ncbi:MAG: hypothetical protein KDI28_05680 [Pseudomonadales bacterium]|nr:hypothetical protein [Pseudomonadales bacterium]MCP5356655.1 acetate kinase [Pseudomonadales bacterium]